VLQPQSATSLAHIVAQAPVCHLQELAAEIERLKLDLVCTREKNGVYLSAERYEQVGVSFSEAALWLRPLAGGVVSWGQY
jgi:hypothetical protein